MEYSIEYIVDQQGNVRISKFYGQGRNDFLQFKRSELKFGERILSEFNDEDRMLIARFNGTEQEEIKRREDFKRQQEDVLKDHTVLMWETPKQSRYSCDEDRLAEK